MYLHFTLLYFTITVRLLQGHCTNTLSVPCHEIIPGKVLCLSFCRNEASDDAARKADSRVFMIMTTLWQWCLFHTCDQQQSNR